MVPRLRYFLLLAIAFAAAAASASPQIGENLWPKTISSDQLPPGAISRLGSTSSPDTSPVVALVCSPDGKSLASLESKGTVRLWDLKTFKEIRQFPGNRGGTQAIALSPDGKQIATLGRNDNLVLLNTQTGVEEIWPDSPTTKFFDLAYSLDGSLLAGREDTGKVRMWRTVDRKLHPLDRKVAGRRTLPSHPTANISRWRSRIPQKARGFACGILQPGHRSWKSKFHKPMRRNCPTCPISKGSCPGPRFGLRSSLPLPANRFSRLGGSHPGTHGLALSPDGKLLATYRWRITDDDIHVWEAASGKERSVFPGHGAKINALAISPDGKLLFTGSDDSTVLAWDLLGLRRASAKSPTASELDAMWIALAGDQPADAIANLIIHKGEGMALCKDKLPAEIRLVAGEAERLEKLIAELDDMRYAVRQKAQQELQQLGMIAKRRLEKVIGGTPTLEMRRRAEQIIGRLHEEQQPLPSTTVLRGLRRWRCWNASVTRMPRRCSVTLCVMPAGQS